MLGGNKVPLRQPDAHFGGEFRDSSEPQSSADSALLFCPGNSGLISCVKSFFVKMIHILPSFLPTYNLPTTITLYKRRPNLFPTIWIAY